MTTHENDGGEAREGERRGIEGKMLVHILTFSPLPLSWVPFLGAVKKSCVALANKIRGEVGRMVAWESCSLPRIGMGDRARPRKCLCLVC